MQILIEAFFYFVLSYLGILKNIVITRISYDDKTSLLKYSSSFIIWVVVIFFKFFDPVIASWFFWLNCFFHLNMLVNKILNLDHLNLKSIDLLLELSNFLIRYFFVRFCFLNYHFLFKLLNLGCEDIVLLCNLFLFTFCLNRDYFLFYHDLLSLNFKLCFFDEVFITCFFSFLDCLLLKLN